MKRESVTVFPDTNSLLHYPPIKDIDWRAVCDAKSVKIVFCMQVIHELDEKKSDSRLSDRAQRVIKEINQLSKSSDPVRGGVTLAIFNCEIRAADFPDTLSIDSKDDRIVHLVKKYIEQENDTDVVVYSEDMGMQLRCEVHNIEVIEPDIPRLQSPLTEQEKKYKATFNELAELKTQKPELDLIICKQDEEPIAKQPIKFILSRAFDTVDVDEAVANEKERIGTPVKPIVPFGLDHIPQDEWDIYLQELDEYFVRYKAWVELINQAKDENARKISFMLHVSNVGNSPSQDVSILCTFPPIFQYILCKKDIVGKHPIYPEKPRPPKELKPQFLAMAEMFTSLEDITLGISSETFLSDLKFYPRIWDPRFYLESDTDIGFSIRVKIPKLNHYNQESFGPFEIMFNSWGQVKPFNIGSQLIAANLTKKKKWEIPFLVELT